MLLICPNEYNMIWYSGFISENDKATYKCILYIIILNKLKIFPFGFGKFCYFWLSSLAFHNKHMNDQLKSHP